MRMLRGVYAYVGRLPDGCIQCMQGVKMVVFVTGLCGDNCFYCPVSPKRLYHDVSYVDEEPADNLWDVVEEAYRIGADGAAVTGGDPLAVPRRTVAVIRTLKEFMGPGFHVHLYTSGRYLTSDALRMLEDAGLDELRLHPTVPGLERVVEKALRLRRSMRVGVEVPAVPGWGERLWKLIKWLDSIGADFINLNELEVSERNIEALLERGLHPLRGRPVVAGSEELALELVRRAEEEGLGITVHYCPASYKDRVQMRLRLMRKALRLAKPYERVTVEGLLESAEASVAEASGLVEQGLGEIVGGLARLPVWLPGGLPRGARRVKRYPSVYTSESLPMEVEGIT